MDREKNVTNFNFLSLLIYGLRIFEIGFVSDRSVIFLNLYTAFPVTNFSHLYYTRCEQAFEELETLLARNNICIAVKERLVKDSGEADERAYDAIVSRLLTRPRARGKPYQLLGLGNS